MRKPILIIVFSTILAGSTYAQNQTQKDSSKVTLKSTTTLAKQEEPEEEVVDGIWAVGTYLSKKLAGEVSNRMNLDESSEPVARKPKKVVFKIAGIKIERTE